METPILQSLGGGRFAVREVVQEDGTRVRIEVVVLFSSCRVVERAVEDDRATGRHWCYRTFSAAAMAALVWDGGETSEPAGYARRGGAPLALTWMRALD